MRSHQVVIVGGGAAGFFGAIACAESRPGTQVAIIEKGAEFLSKVLISGGGRCNVTHACFDPRELSAGYPRGAKELIGAFHRFQPRDTIRWFESHGVQLKTESDGRVFPVSDSSRTIADCLLDAARAAGVSRQAHCGVDKVAARQNGGFLLTLSNGEMVECEQLLLATGGCRTAAAGRLAVLLGHSLESPVPSLFTFTLDPHGFRGLAGISVGQVAAGIPGSGLIEHGALLITHRGVSGPVILRLSAWGARALHDLNYRFGLHLNWLPHLGADGISEQIKAYRHRQPTRLVANTPIPPLPARLWEHLVQAAGVPRDTRWAALGRTHQNRLIQLLTSSELSVVGKNLNKEEFVTCGGVRLSEVDFRTMESRICPGLYLAGELLDIDGITGGYNFQAAWTTGWLAGQALGKQLG